MPSPAFTLRIFESEYREIEDLVLKYPNIETGGDLFGLWTRDADPVVQLIIGPGQRCRRTSVSFHQDTDYLQNVGTYVNTSFMLCHIGSWHSHHQLSLNHPSAGERSTVCNNFPPGLERYIMIIANIERSTQSGTKSVVIHPYMFTYEGRIFDEGSVEVIQNASPFREDRRVQREITKGMEMNYPPLDRPYVSHPSTKSPLIHDCEFRHQDNKHGHGTEKRDVQKPSEADQWYSSATGQAKLLEINDGIMALNQNQNQTSDKPQLTRHQHSCDLTLEFVHNDRKWFIEFPKSFDKDDAKIFYPSSDFFILCKDVVQSVQNFCGCESCRTAGLSRRIVLENSECEMTAATIRSKDKMQEPSLGLSQEESKNELPRAKENVSYLNEDSYDEIMKPSTPERLNSYVPRSSSSSGRSKSPRSNKQRHSPYHSHRVRKGLTRDLCIENETDQKLKAVARLSILESMGKPVTSKSPKNEPRGAVESDKDASEDEHDQITNVRYIGDHERLSSSSETDTSDYKLRTVRSNDTTEYNIDQGLTGTSFDSDYAERLSSLDETGILYDQRLLATLESNDGTEYNINQELTGTSFDGDHAERSPSLDHQRLLGTLENNDGTEYNINQQLTGTSYDSDHEQSSSPGETGILYGQFHLRTVDIKDRSGYNIQEQTSTSYDGDYEQSFSSGSSTTFESFMESCNQERLADASGPSAEPQSRSARESSSTATRNASAPEETQWYESTQGNEKLKTIYQQIVSDLKVPKSDVGFSRQENSHDLIVGFHHNGYKWTVEFPKSFDEEDAIIERTTEGPPNALSNSIVHSKNIVKGIQELCRCNECKVENDKEEMAKETNQQQDENLARSSRIPTVTQHTQSSPERPNEHNRISGKSESQSYERGTPESPNFDISPSSPSKLDGGFNYSPRRRNREANRVTKNEAKSIFKEVRSFVGQDHCWSQPNTYVPRQTFSFNFDHGSLSWVIFFLKEFPQIPARLYKRENVSRTFCKDVTPANVLQTVRDFCPCRKCVVHQTKK